MCIYFKTETENHYTGRSLSEENMGIRGQFLRKTDALYTELNESVEAATSSYFATGEFLQYIYTVPVAKNDQKI